MEFTLLRKDESLNTPSNRDGVDRLTEQSLRIYGCDVLQQAGSCLRLPQVTVATSQMLFNRFYYVHSLRDYDVRDVVLGAMFVATKVEETHRPPRALLTVMHHVLLLREYQEKHEGASIADVTQVPILSVFSTRYGEMKVTLFSVEREILTALGFKVSVRHPHRYILAYLKILHCHENKPLAQSAWNYLNDSSRTRVGVLYKPSLIAVAGVYLAARKMAIALPDNWWKLFEAQLWQVEDICCQILEICDLPPPRYISI